MPKPTGLDAFLSRTMGALAEDKLITPLFEEALLRGDALPPEWSIKIYEKEKQFDGYFHPSGDCDLEPLQLWYKLARPDDWIRERPHPSLEMIFRVGDTYHSLIQSMWLWQGFVDKDDVESSFVNEEHHVSGTLDVRAFKLRDNSTVPVELKSTSFLPKKPFAKHIQQLQIYMALGCPEPQERGVLFYLCKSGDHRIAEFVLHRDEDLVNRILDKWDAVWDAVQRDDPSEFQNCCVPDGATHKSCPARNICRIGAPQTTIGKA